MPNPWDALSEQFNANKHPDQIDPGTADNILMAWPTMIEQVGSYFKNSKDIAVLDYGCGAGAFCKKLYSLGYKNVTGIDSSPAMVEVAKRNYGEDVNFVCGSAEMKLSVNLVDLISSIMVFQFLDPVERTFQNLIQILKPRGLLIFAVFNPVFVTASLKIKSQLFSHFSLVEESAQGIMHSGERAIPVYIRTAREYDAILQSLGMTKVYESYPPFTEEFLATYGADTSDVPKFLIVGYSKT